jgi:hypothetical protein
MKRAHLRTIFALAAIAVLPALVRAQVTPPPATPAPATSTTPDPGLYKIPPTTPVGMPAYSISPMATAAGVETPTSSRPTKASDCADGGWQTYSALGFKTEAACQAWVKKHPAGAAAVRTPGAKASGTKSRATTPRVRATTPAIPHAAETTPGSSITPLPNPTPIPR